jgi:hypothetical protein
LTEPGEVHKITGLKQRRDGGGNGRSETTPGAWLVPKVCRRKMRGTSGRYAGGDGQKRGTDPVPVSAQPTLPTDLRGQGARDGELSYLPRVCSSMIFSIESLLKTKAMPSSM